MNERAGHLRFPHALAYRLDHEIRSPAQRWVLLALADEAQWQAATVRVPASGGVTVHLDVGEVLTSQRSFADRHRLGQGNKGRQLFRRALRAGELAEVISTRPAKHDPCNGPSPSPRCGPHSDPPPTIVRFLVFRAEMWGRPEARPTSRPESDPAPGETAGPIQDPSKDQDENRAEPPPAAPAVESRSKGQPPPEFRASQEAIRAAFNEATGADYHWQGAKDTEALKRLLPHGLDAVLDRWGRGLRGTGWRQVRTVAQLASKWNDLVDRANGAALPVDRFSDYTGPVDLVTGKPFAGGAP